MMTTHEVSMISKMIVTTTLKKRKEKITMYVTETAEVFIEAFYEDGDEPDNADASVMCTYISSLDEDDLLEEVENDYSIYG